MGSGQHEITTCWQFAPGRVDIDLDSFSVHATDARGPRLEIRPLLGELKPDIELFGGLTSPLRGWVSVGGRDLPALSCRYRVITELPVTLLWLLFPYPGMPPSRPEAIVLREHPSAFVVAVGWDNGTQDYIDVTTLLR